MDVARPLSASLSPPPSGCGFVLGARRRGRGGPWRRVPRRGRSTESGSPGRRVPARAHVAVCCAGCKLRWGPRNRNFEQLPFVQVCVLEGAGASEAGDTLINGL